MTARKPPSEATRRKIAAAVRRNWRDPELAARYEAGRQKATATSLARRQAAQAELEALRAENARLRGESA